MPAVQVGEPEKAKERYQFIEIDNVNVYLSPSIKIIGEEAVVKLKGFWVFKDLEITGVKC
ncbi:MAG: CC/Se motif family (seleno)protein [Bacillota bacterium]